jgi:hypothetical protein
MKATLRELRPDDLGSQATDADVEEFVGYCWAALQRGLAETESEAIDLVFGDGDYYANVARLGLDEVQS